MQSNYSVQIEDFADRHFIKSFQKKHKDKWSFTLKAIIAELNHIDNLLRTDKAETIIDADDLKVIKTKFKIAGTQESAKASGNRCIVIWCSSKQLVSVLLVYAKTDLGDCNETAKWQSMIKENYPEYRGLFKWGATHKAD